MQIGCAVSPPYFVQSSKVVLPTCLQCVYIVRSSVVYAMCVGAQCIYIHNTHVGSNTLYCAIGIS